MKILIVGSSGHIGSVIFEALMREIEVYKCDREDLLHRNPVLADMAFDFVINAAHDFERPWRSHLIVRSLFRFYMSNRSILIHLSSVAVYPNTTGTFNCSDRLIFAKDPYGWAKIREEREIERCVRDRGKQTKSVILRLPVVLGDGSMWQREISKMCSAGKLYLPRAGAATLNYISTQDIAVNVVNLTKNNFDFFEDKISICNLVGPESLSWRDFLMKYVDSPVSRIELDIHRRYHHKAFKNLILSLLHSGVGVYFFICALWLKRTLRGLRANEQRLDETRLPLPAYRPAGYSRYLWLEQVYYTQGEARRLGLTLGGRKRDE